MNNIFENICQTLILFNIFAIYFFHYYAANKKVAITHLWNAMEPRSMYHVIAKDKVPQQHISSRNCKCNTFAVMSHLLKVAEIAITDLSLGLRQQNPKTFQGRENSLRQLIAKNNL